MCVNYFQNISGTLSSGTIGGFSKYNDTAQRLKIFFGFVKSSCRIKKAVVAGLFYTQSDNR